jgi:D-glycero-D-manno-heptose 1,7-bisphosphate phosphatase
MIEPRGLIVLDRDGILNRMVSRGSGEPLDSPMYPAEIDIISGVPSTLRRLQDAGYVLAIATNQPAAAKGKATRAELEAVHAKILAEIQAEGARIASAQVCYHRAEDGCSCRKPKSGLLEAVLAAVPGCRATAAWMVGDRATDVMAGAALGFSTALLGAGWPADDDVLRQLGLRPSFRGGDLRAFADFLLGEGAATV